MSNLVVPHDPQRLRLAHELRHIHGIRAKLSYVARRYPHLLNEYVRHFADSAGPAHHHHRPARTVPAIKQTALTAKQPRRK
jgi:hypothetical protein